MVTYAEVSRRHAAYTFAVIATIVLAKYTWILTAVLCALLASVKWHMHMPVHFTVIVSIGGALATALCVQLSHETLWFAHGIEHIGVPPWLPPAHALAAHWVMDMFWIVTLRDARKAALP